MIYFTIMKFQYISDIHYEHGNTIEIPPIGDYLILAGDIGDPNKDYFLLFNKVSKNYKAIFIVAGNHEYYSKNTTMDQTETVIKEICAKFPNVYYLQNDVYHIADADVSIFGATMWTHINECDKYDINCCIGDYRCIPGFTIEKCNKLHKISIDKLQECIVGNEDRRWIVITHHVPQSYLIHPKYQGNRLNAAYASDIPYLDQDHIKAVVYGHTHMPSVQGKYYCNPIGYPMENKNHNLEACFEI